MSVVLVRAICYLYIYDKKGTIDNFLCILSHFSIEYKQLKEYKQLPK